MRRCRVGPLLPASVRLEQHAEIFPFILSALVSEVEKVVVKGVYNDYHAREEDLPLVRGRIALGAQIARYGELKHRHICQYAQLSSDTAENRIVAATLRYASLLLRPSDGGEHASQNAKSTASL